MIGTLINVGAVLTGSLLGLLLGSRFPDRIKQTLMVAIALFTIGLGIQMFLQTENAVLVLVSLLVGGLVGEVAGLEDKLQSLGARLEWLLTRTPRGLGSRFVQGFVASSLLFCVGPIAILGSIQDGLLGDYRLLATKSLMDGIASVTLASTLGVGVMASAIPLLAYQGAITLLAHWAQASLLPSMIRELTATGGVLLAAIGITLLEVRPLRTASLLPALLVAPLLVWILRLMGIRV
ncbi:MAG: DUF554 domain-containing protein [Anaerolineales bacterium]|jgi:uncharacterized membrane protein YqgA involved in biofilm formation